MVYLSDMETISLEMVRDEAVRRIVEIAEPNKIIVFGSAARGELGPDSDLDLLVVVPTGRHRRETAQKIYRHFIGLGFAVDVVVVTEEDIEQFKDFDGMVIQTALAEGQVVYAA